MHLLTATLVAIISCAAAGNLFTWKPSNALTERENWLDSDIPCDGDYIRFDKLKEAVVFLEGDLKVSTSSMRTKEIRPVLRFQGRDPPF